MKNLILFIQAKWARAMALLAFNRHIDPILFIRLATILLIYFGVLFNTFYIQSIGSEISGFSGLFHILNLNFLFDSKYDVFINSLGIFSINSKLNNIIKNYIINLVIILILLYFIINTLLFIIDVCLHYFNNELICNHINIPNGEKNDNVPMNLVRWWSSGVPQSFSIIGTALATFTVLSKLSSVNPRMRVLGALSSAGVTASQVVYHSAIENSVGFNRLMWGLSEYKKTGSWPSLENVVKSTSDTTMTKFVDEYIKQVDNTTVTVESVVNDISANGFVPFSNFDISDSINKLIESIFKETIQILKPVEVQGYLDDLIGQRMLIEIILFIMCISIILLFIFFIFNVIFLLNKDKIKNKFNNKFITFYINYQAFFSRISLIYVPILLFVSLITLCHGLHWLIINQIPYNSLEIDLHKFISSSISLPFLCSTSFIINRKYTNKSNDNKNNNNKIPLSGIVKNNSNVSLLSFLGIKSSKRIFSYMITLILLSLNFIFFPYLKNNYPLIYNSIIDHIFYNYNYYLLTILFWPLIITIYNVIELYFYSYHCNSNNQLYLPKYLPRKIKKSYTRLYEISKSSEKLIYTYILFNNVIIGLILSIISFFAVYLFL